MKVKRSKVLTAAILGLFAVGVLFVYAQVTQRPLNQSGMTTGWSFGTALPTVANDGRPPFDGEPYVLTTDGSSPVLRVYNDSTASWDTNAVAQSANTWTNTNTYRVVRESFEGPSFLATDITNGDFVPTVADTEVNLYRFQDMDIYTRIEIAFAGTNTPSTFINTGTAADAQGRVFLIDDATILDNTDNDAIEYNFGGAPTEAVMFDAENTDSLDAYCEVSVRIDDISDVSALDFYVGLFLSAAINDTFAFTASNTWAAFVINDTSGDLQICAEEDGDTHGCDDGGTTWADDATHVLRVAISTTAVTFSVDGTAVAATNAIMVADATDQFVCRLGIRSAGTSIAVLELNYVEIGHVSS